MNISERLAALRREMEQESIDFHAMVSRGYREVLAGREEVVYIDGSDSVENIRKKIQEEVQKRIADEGKKEPEVKMDRP